MAFEIKLLPDDKKSLESSRREIMGRAGQFVANNILDKSAWQSGHGPLDLEKKEALLARDILNGRFWGTLSCVDGIKYERGDDLATLLGHRETKEEVNAKNERTREWARENFTHFELENILNFAVNQAILRPYNTSWPGTRRGHSVLYDELVAKEGSMFKEAVTDDFSKRLNNGRFWEEIPNVQIGLNHGHGAYVVHDVLENNFEDLEVDFAVAYGLDLMRFALEKRSLEHIDLWSVGETALGRYAEFLSKLDEKVEPKVIEELLMPYVSATLRWDGDEEGPYYNGEEDFDGIQRGKFQDKLQVAVLQKYFKDSPKIQKQLAEILSNGVQYSSMNEFGQYSRFVRGLLDHVPNPKGIMKLMLPNLMTASGIQFFQEAERQGQDLYEFL